MSHSLFRAAYRGHTAENIQIVNTFHVAAHDAALSLFEPSIDDVRDAVDTAFTTLYRGMLSAGFTVDDLTITDVVTPLSGDVPRQSVKSIGAAGTRGSVGTNAAPRAGSLVIQLKTNAAVRGGRGRMWIPLSGDADTTALGIINQSGTLWSSTGNFAAALAASHTVSGTVGSQALFAVIYSRTRHQRGLSDYWFDIKGYVRDPTMHWLRSRTTAP